jgi:hypothetical protein
MTAAIWHAELSAPPFNIISTLYAVVFIDEYQKRISHGGFVTLPVIGGCIYIQSIFIINAATG